MTTILPLAITMMAGPQILTALVLLTTERPVRVSSAFVLAVAITATIGVAIMMAIANLIGLSTSLNSSSGPTTTAKVIESALVALLIFAAIKAYLGRETSKPPKFLGKVQEAGPAEAFKTGMLLIGLMPSDLVVMLTVGINLVSTESSLVDALPFIALTALVAALPLLAYLLFHRRAVAAMPQVRTWANTHGWLVQIITCLIFIVLILA